MPRSCSLQQQQVLFRLLVSLQVGCTFMGEGVFFPPLIIEYMCSNIHTCIRCRNTQTLGLCEVQTPQWRLVGIERSVLTHPYAPQACGYHKGLCHMCSRYIPALWCQFVHLTLGLQIHSSETPQLKANLNTLHPPPPIWMSHGQWTVPVSLTGRTGCNYVHIEDRLVKKPSCTVGVFAKSQMLFSIF